MVQVRDGGRGQAYVASRMATGDGKTEAVRLLRRRISDEVFRRLLADEWRPSPNRTINALPLLPIVAPFIPTRVVV